MANENPTKLKPNTRVKRKSVPGCLGTVQDIREEVTPTRDIKHKALIVRVLWDNGTLSQFDPDGLEVVS